MSGFKLASLPYALLASFWSVAANAQLATDADLSAQRALSHFDTVAAHVLRAPNETDSLAVEHGLTTDRYIDIRHDFERRFEQCEASHDQDCTLIADELWSIADTWNAASSAISPSHTDRLNRQQSVFSPTAVDTTPPVLNSLTLSPETVDMDAGERRITAQYDVSDAGIGLEVLSISLRPVGWRAFEPTIYSGPIQFNYERHAEGEISFEIPEHIWEGDYQPYLQLRDRLGNYAYFNDLAPSTPSQVTILNSNEDRDAPIVNYVTVNTENLTMTGSNDQLVFEYDLEDVGPSGLNSMVIRLFRRGDTISAFPILIHDFEGVQSTKGRLALELPNDFRSGVYDIEFFANDKARNISHNYERGIVSPASVTITNPNSDSFPPRVNRLTVSPEQVNLSNEIVPVTVRYDLSDEGGSGLEDIRLTIRHEDTSDVENQYSASPINILGKMQASGEIVIPIPPDARAGRYRVELVLRDRANNYTAYYHSTFSSPNTIQINSGDSRVFGPFDWVNSAQAGDQEVFRLTGVPSGPPRSIRIAINNAMTSEFYDSFEVCELTIRPARHSGSEYLITAADLLDCGGFQTADLRFEITPAAADLNEELLLRRFRISPSGMLTDMSVDRMQLNNRDTNFTAEFGPFEWTESSPQIRQHFFRLAGLRGVLPESIQVAIENASEPGFAGEYTDCTLPLNLSSMNYNQYLITQEDLTACGEFGRADLSFRVSKIDGTPAATMRRYVRTQGGAVSDLAFDQIPVSLRAPTSLSDGLAEVVLGPFEWTGDANAPTQSLFRITGLSGQPRSIELALNNALQDGYQGDFTDCSLPIRAANAGVNDYIISSADLIACGAFGRADISFRVVAEAEQIPSGLMMRRFALGADGDITDFSFDHDPASTRRPLDMANDRARVEFGPFEWTGGHNAGTQNVFRIVGVTGQPEKIDVALENATAEGYAGGYTDCSLTYRPERSNGNEYIITAADLRDCGDFVRANARFRIIAERAQFDNAVQMRRFAVSRTGGLTDFGFDNQ
ncbi:hypothetical protein [Oceanicaulis sp.]|uniref:hypothetical protein n=1 Tax=Oceanicaulis sp. TaxID=1924941 RepID=UPI003F7030C3